MITGMDYYRRKSGDIFTSVDELEEIVLQLDVASEIPIYYEDPDAPGLAEQAGNYKGIYNHGTRSLSKVASKQYGLLQHRDAYASLVTALRKAEFEGYGIVKNLHDYVSVELTFADVLVNDGEDGIEMGLKLVNSYDSSAAFKGWGWGLRKVCSNGMYARAAIPETHFSAQHRGDMTPSVESIYNVVEESRSRLMNLESVIVDRKQVEMDFPESESVIATLAPVIGSYSGAIKAVEKHWNGELDTNRWDAYNITTAYVSHEPISENQFHNIQRRAETFLMSDRVTIIVPEDVEAVEATVA